MTDDYATRRSFYRRERPETDKPVGRVTPAATPPGLARMRDRTPEGVCPFCGIDPLAQKPGKKRSATCGAVECKKAYHRTYQRDYRQGLKVREQQATGPNGGRRR